MNGMLSRNWFRAAILLCVAHSLVASAAVIPDSTKSPLPEKRTALLTAFSDGLDSYFFNPADPDFYRSRQAELKAKFVAKGYAVTAMIPTRPNEPEPPASHPGYYTIPDFESELRGGKYGVLATDGHAGNIGIAVEHFLNDADVQTRLQDLRDAGYPAGEVESFIFGAEEKVIAISKVFIVNRAQLAQNALVWVYGCNTFRWFNRNTANPLNPATADIVFLDPAIGGVFFVGTNASCGADPQTRLNFFGRMLGDTPLGGVKKNWTVKEAFDQAASENGQLLARARSGDTSVYRLRLRNEPRRLKTTITQSPVYDYSYADQAYPFVDGDYPGDLSSAVKGFGHTGPMNVVIQFSEPMDSSWSGFKAQLVPQSGGTPIDFTGSWSTTLFPNDTWTGNLTVPADGSFPDGQMNVAITARDAYNDDDSSQSPDGEMDTTGDGLAHGKDTLVNFPIKPWLFVVGEAVAVVRGEPRVFGPKLASERLHGIQARAIPRRGEPLHGIRMPGQVFEARKVMSQPSVRIGEDSNQRLAKPSVYRPKGGKPTVFSPARLAGYEPSSLSPVVGARPHRAPPSFRTVIKCNLPGVAVVLRRAPPPLALQNLGKAGKKDRGDMK